MRLYNSVIKRTLFSLNFFQSTPILFGFQIISVNLVRSGLCACNYRGSPGLRTFHGKQRYRIYGKSALCLWSLLLDMYLPVWLLLNYTGCTGDKSGLIMQTKVHTYINNADCSQLSYQRGLWKTGQD